MKVFRNICRILLGLVFIFSGFVKAVDPLGFKYKFEEYFQAMGFDWLVPAALIFVLVLITIEFYLGVTFLFNIKIKQLSWLMLLFMVFFFFLTLWLAITDKVTDCGCFGDAIVLTNKETFFKNVILIIPALVVFFTRKQFVNNMNCIVKGIIAWLGIGFILFIMLYSLFHLPVIDFMPWKKGNIISQQVVPQKEIAKILLVYKNKETGQLSEYTSKNLPYKDTVLWKKLEFVEQKKQIIQPFMEAPIHDFMVDDSSGESHNDEIIANPDWQFLLVSTNLDHASRSVFPGLNAFVDSCLRNNVSFVGLSGSDWTKIAKFKQEVKATFDYYVVDETALKSVVRSNPGLVLLKNGVVIDKWAWRDLPDYDDFRKIQARYEKCLKEIEANWN